MSHVKAGNRGTLDMSTVTWKYNMYVCSHKYSHTRNLIAIYIALVIKSGTSETNAPFSAIFNTNDRCHSIHKPSFFLSNCRTAESVLVWLDIRYTQRRSDSFDFVSSRECVDSRAYKIHVSNLIKTVCFFLFLITRYFAFNCNCKLYLSSVLFYWWNYWSKKTNIYIQ